MLMVDEKKINNDYMVAETIISQICQNFRLLNHLIENNAYVFIINYQNTNNFCINSYLKMLTVYRVRLLLQLNANTEMKRFPVPIKSVEVGIFNLFTFARTPLL